MHKKRAEIFVRGHEDGDRQVDSEKKSMKRLEKRMATSCAFVALAGGRRETEIGAI